MSKPPSDAGAETEYRGETRERKRWVAVLLSYLCPGMAYMYVGQLLKGITVNLLFLLMLEAFVIVFSVVKFFPLLPSLVLITSWLVFSSFVATTVVEKIEEEEEPYLLRGYNHWMIYAVIFLLTYFVPVWVTGYFVSEYLLKFETVHSSAMYPTVQSGETVLIDASAYRSRKPKRGELVALRPEGEDDLSILRVVGVENDVIRIEGETVWVNEEPLERSALATEEIQAPGIDPQEGDLLAMVEHNHGNRYVISVSPKAFSALSLEPIKLKEGEFFVLADNRSEIGRGNRRVRDSRHFGPVTLDAIDGKPGYIAWSRESKSGDIRLGRIGLKTE